MQKMPSVSSTMDGSRLADNGKMQLECLELAGCTLDRYINMDNSRPSFLEITGVAAQRSSTCSGLNAGDYKNLAALLNHPNLSQLKVINKVPLPPEIMEHFAHLQCHCLMGVFPEISRVWLTIDSNIYVWAFEQGSDVAYFDGLGETILSVGLVKPKPGVFQEFVKYLLVLTTTVEIIVLGVTFSSTKSDGIEEHEEMHLVPEPVFLLPSDGISMMSVKATSKGRIFLGGRDGCLYEITYQAQLGWFGKHCKKVNHSTSALSFLVPSFINAALYDDDSIVKIEVDDSRHILYTLSEKGCIEMFDLGRDGESLTKVARLTQGKIVSMAVDVVKTLEPNVFKPVISISAVDESESSHLNLVAVTQAGTRLYFTAGTGEAPVGSVESRPMYLSLLHVRLPPGFTPNASVLKPKLVHSAAYENGTLLMVSSSGTSGGGGEAETLWCLSRVFPGSSFTEAHSLLTLDGPALALTPLPPAPTQHHSQAVVTKKDPWAVSRWAAVTGAGVAVLAAGAAPDLLRALLVDCRGPDAPPVQHFFQVGSAEAACACAALLACEEAECGELAVPEWAARAFFLYGAAPARAMPAPPGPVPHVHPHQATLLANTMASPKFSPRQMSTPMTSRGPQMQFQQNKFGNQSGPNQSFPGSPGQPFPGPQSPYQQHATSPATYNQSAPFNQSYGNATQPPMQAEFSAKHNGLYIYVGRILTPLWNLKCVEKVRTPENKEYLCSVAGSGALSAAAWRLRRAASFAQRVAAPPGPEQHSLHALKLFINMAIEMLSLWKILCEHQFHVIAATLPPEQQSALQAASFRELLVGGQEVAGLLLGALVGGYLRDNASVDGISQKLRQLCPALYRQEDATCSKANELLIFAKQQKNQAEREEMLHHALKLCKDVAPNVNLPVVCSKLISVGFYSGVVDLCVTCASKIDPHNKALHYYKSDQPSPDREGHLAYYRRMEIYREVCVALERLYERNGGAGADGMSPTRATDISSPDTTVQGRKLLWECLSRDDELLHVAVYEWLVSKRLGSELICAEQAPPPSLQQYLVAAARAAPPPAAAALRELLWRALQRAGDHLAAAAELDRLAATPGGGATLEQRMSWLSAGIVCVRGAGGAGGAGGELLRRLEEALEVAGVQRRVRAALCARLSAPPAPAPAPAPHPRHLQRLDDDLLEITQLYEEYADRYNLWECKLAIVQCSGHNDPLLVESIWSNILAEAEAAARPLPTPDEQMASVLSKVTTLGKEYINTGHCFPLYFIVRQLEIISCKFQSDHQMVYKAILNIGVSLDQVLDIYIKLVSVKERAWLALGDELHVCRACCALLEGARLALQGGGAGAGGAGAGAGAGSDAPPARRRRRARAKDLHEAVLSALQARPNTQHLIDRISVAQAYLDRMD